MNLFGHRLYQVFLFIRNVFIEEEATSRNVTLLADAGRKLIWSLDFDVNQ